MATPKFDPNKPSGIGADDSTGKKWINQGPWRFDPITKELLPGQIPEPSLAAPPAPEKKGGIEMPEVTDPAHQVGPAVTHKAGGVTDPGAAPHDRVTQDKKEVTGSGASSAAKVTHHEKDHPSSHYPFPDGKKDTHKK